MNNFKGFASMNKLAAVMFIALIALLFTACERGGSNPVEPGRNSNSLAGTSWLDTDLGNDELHFINGTEGIGIRKDWDDVYVNRFIYTYSNGNITLLFSESTISGSVNGNKMTFTRGGERMVFNKMQGGVSPSNVSGKFFEDYIEEIKVSLYSNNSGRVTQYYGSTSTMTTHFCSYTKTGNNTATLIIDFSPYNNTNEMYEYNLTFTSSNSGVCTVTNRYTYGGSVGYYDYIGFFSLK